MNSFYLLLDMGSTSIKCSLIETGTTRLKHMSSAPTPQFLNTSNEIREIDPDALINTCKGLIAGFLNKGFELQGLLITGQMGCWILTNLENRPLTNLVSWQDTRGLTGGTDGSNSYNVLDKKIAKELRSCNGNEFRVGLPVVGVYQAFQDNPHLDSEIRFHSLISWVSSQLSENYRFIVHDTDAAASGFFDIWEHEWASIATSLFPGELFFPEVSNDLLQVGFNLELSCPVFTPVGDQQSSLMGIGLHRNQIAVNIGTGGQIAKIVDNLERNELQIRPYFQGRFLLTKTHLPAGRSIAQFLTFILGSVPQSEDYAWMNTQPLSPNQSAEIDVMNYQSEIKRLSTSSNLNKESLAANVLESIAKVYEVEIQKLRDKSDSELLMAGGIGNRMTSIGRTLGKNLDMRVEFSDTEDTTLQGLANIANTL
jgi:sugar (pentulose or hexulose) kinase